MGIASEKIVANSSCASSHMSSLGRICAALNLFGPLHRQHLHEKVHFQQLVNASACAASQYRMRQELSLPGPSVCVQGRTESMLSLLVCGSQPQDLSFRALSKSHVIVIVDGFDPLARVVDIQNELSMRIVLDQLRQERHLWSRTGGGEHAGAEMQTMPMVTCEKNPVSGLSLSSARW